MSLASDIRPTYVALVDDDKSVLRSLGRLLRATGMHPVAYDSAEAFLTDTKRPQFDCLVLDIQLGGISGIELHQRLNAVGSTIPVIYLTARDDLAAHEAALAAGCAAYFRKNDSGEAFLEAIRQAAGLGQDNTKKQQTTTDRTNQRKTVTNNET